MESPLRFLQPPRGSFFLLGPRGTGKTTWLRQNFPDALVLDRQLGVLVAVGEPRPTWRTRSGVEVDFVVHGPAGFWAIEVKNAPRVRPEDLAGLDAFGADYSEATRVLLHRGDEQSRVRGTWCLPVERFLKELRPDRGLTEWLPE